MIGQLNLNTLLLSCNRKFMKWSIKQEKMLSFFSIMWMLIMLLHYKCMKAKRFVRILASTNSKIGYNGKIQLLPLIQKELSVLMMLFQLPRRMMVWR